MRRGIAPGRVPRDRAGAGLPGRRAGWWGAAILLSCLAGPPAAAQQAEGPPEPSRPPAVWPESQPEWNERAEQLESESGASLVGIYRIGPHDLLDISVFEAPELNRSVRVTGGGEIYLPLLGPVRATGLSEEELAR
ncbi:MAG: polysaccharide biosynthesis/export family protein, partial [Terriglobia bacterium]